MPEATRAAAELKQALSIDSKLTEGKGGIFDVTVNGMVVFSKDKVYRFPEDGELAKLINAI
ncbi:MAG TPA: Rdx family protein [bacterium]